MWTLLRQEVDRLEKIAERFLSFARPTKPNLVEHPLEAIYLHMVGSCAHSSIRPPRSRS